MLQQARERRRCNIGVWPRWCVAKRRCNAGGWPRRSATSRGPPGRPRSQNTGSGKVTGLGLPSHARKCRAGPWRSRAGSVNCQPRSSSRPTRGSSAPRLCRQADHRICTVLAGAVVLPTWRPGRGGLLRPFWQANAW